ncbi:uncharacterized protein LOC118761855 [Octopus sinensis]|uniref:Uncharacterized protein LOC118761855 n=1 Tax=Octopus sinensis TaxID=2607531 RepID=A0A7E6ELS1_9MOLL|nr:uncharacterized protein LOC118761855 [Octopus sinensis]
MPPYFCWQRKHFCKRLFDVLHIIGTNEDFWPRQSYNPQLWTPTLNNYIYIEDCYNITNILPMSTSSILIIYKNKKAKLFTDNGEIINQNNSVFLEPPSFCCRINANRFLVFYCEMKGFQYITCPELRKGPLIKVQTGYMKICHIVSNKCLAVTTTENKSEVHILLINEDKVDIAERISLGHHNVSIAATPINFVVVDGNENKMVFYSTCGEELFQKYLPFYGHPHHIYSDNVYFYVLFRRHSILRCYDLYGQMKWQWELPFPVHTHIAVFQGTLYVPDSQLNRVLLYKYQDRSSACLLPIKNPYIRNLNLRLKEKENDQKLVIGDGRHLHFVDIDEIHSSVKEIKKINIPELLMERNEDGNYSDGILEIKVTDGDVIIVLNTRFIIFFNRGGQYLHSVRHYMEDLGGDDDTMTIDDSFLYIQCGWEKSLHLYKYRNILCLTQNGEYKRIFLNKRIYKDKVDFFSIDCKGPRFVGSPWKEERNELYVEGLFMVNRDSFPVARLQTDECPVQVKDFDVSEEGKTVCVKKPIMEMLKYSMKMASCYVTEMLQV